MLDQLWLLYKKSSELKSMLSETIFKVILESSISVLSIRIIQ
jgi:hypothetical protein